jgi:hypothetical protein
MLSQRVEADLKESVVGGPVDVTGRRWRLSSRLWLLVQGLRSAAPAEDARRGEATAGVCKMGARVRIGDGLAVAPGYEHAPVTKE